MYDVSSCSVSSPVVLTSALYVLVLSNVQLFVTLWTIAHQVSRSMEFSRQEYWSGLPFLSPMDLPNPGIEPASPAFPVLAGRFFTIMPPGNPYLFTYAVKLLVVLICNSLLTTMSFVCPYLYPIQYFYLENSTDRRSWQAIVQGDTKSWTRLSTYTLIYNWYITGHITLRCTV